MFILPNNKQIDYEAVIDAMINPADKHIYWLDSETGECLLESMLIKKIGTANFNSEKNKKYFKVPKITNFSRLQWMASYITEMVEFENEEFAKKLEKIINRENPYINFVKVLKKSKDGWIYGWDSWEGDSAFEEMKEWFKKLPFEIKEEMEFFCDCPICQAMKEGRTSEKDLKHAFREANFKNVLGDIYQDNKD